MFSGNPGDTPGTSGFKANPYQLNNAAFTDPNADANRQMLLQAMQQSQGFTQGQPWQTNQGNQNQLIAALQGTAAGTGPNPAQAQFAQNVNTANQGALSMAGSQQGGNNPALALRQAMTAQQGNLQGAAGQAATLQAQQQIAAQQQLAAALGQQQSGQLSAQQTQQQGGQGYGSLIQQQSQQQTANQIAQQQLASQNYNAAMGLNQNTSTNNANAMGNLVGGVLGGGGAALSMLPSGGGAALATLSEGGAVSNPPQALPSAFAQVPMLPVPLKMAVGGSVEDMTAQASAQNAALAASFMHLPGGTTLKPMDLTDAGSALGAAMARPGAAPGPAMAGDPAPVAPPGEMMAAKGGEVQGPGSEHSDSVPAMLSKGEFVDSAPMVHELGEDLLNQLNEEGKLAHALRSVGRHKEADLAAPHIAALKAAMMRKAA